MQTIEYAINSTKDKVLEAEELVQFHDDAQKKWAGRLSEYKEQLDELNRAREVLKENGF